MSKNSEFITIRPSDLETAYLNKIAIENMLVKKNGEPSLGLAVKHILKEKMIENEQKNKQEAKGDLEHITQLLEQIHITIPHIVHASRFSSMYASKMFKSANISQDATDKFNENILLGTNKICGQIQEKEYKTLYVSSDLKNMKTIPIDKDKSEWK